MTTTARPRDVQEITIDTDSREILANARRDTVRYGLDDYFIVDVDSHHVEQDAWPEIIARVQDPVMRDSALQMFKNWPQAGNLALLHHAPGLDQQDVGGRIVHQAHRAEPTPDNGVPRDVTLVRRAMDAMSIDIQVVFPQPMLAIGLHPRPDVALQLMLAYNEWFTETRRSLLWESVTEGGGARQNGVVRSTTLWPSTSSVKREIHGDNRRRAWDVKHGDAAGPWTGGVERRAAAGVRSAGGSRR